jgi:hypothetical protein
MDLRAVCDAISELPSASSQSLDARDKLVVYDLLINGYVLKQRENDRLNALLDVRKQMYTFPGIRAMIEDMLVGRC